jgi:hypothetical protein
MNDFPVIIPDALLAWGKAPEVAVHFARPWATDIETLVAKGQLDRLDTRKLMSKLEALCAEACRAGRGDLIGGLDTRTAEFLNISYSFEAGDGRKVEIGRGKRYSWSELRAILATDDPKDALRAVDRVKDLLDDVFPEARVTDVSDTAEEEPTPCASCGSPSSQVMMTTVHGTHHCGTCWARLTDTSPANFTIKRKNMTRGNR